jgi:hypothetical protein
MDFFVPMEGERGGWAITQWFQGEISDKAAIGLTCLAMGKLLPVVVTS